jgi:hypothetical protein
MKCGAACAAALVILGASAGVGRGGGISWAEAVQRLAGERSNAQVCVATLKGRGSQEQIARGRLTYGAAKADFDGVIAGLITALDEGGNPASLPTLQTDLERGASVLKTFCKTAEDLAAVTPGEKGLLQDMLRGAVEQLLKPLSDGVATIYNNHRNDKEAIRRTIQTQLEAAKWPDFDKVNAVQ